MESSNHSFTHRFVIVISLFSFAVLVGVFSIRIPTLPHLQVSISNPAALAAPPGWGGDIRLTIDNRASNAPVIKTDSVGNSHVVWVDGTSGSGNEELYYTKLDRNGATLIEDIRLTNAPGSSLAPRMAIATDDTIHLVWHDTRTGVSQLYYRKLDANGTTLVPDTVFTASVRDSDFASIVFDQSGNLHVVWLNQGANGREEIYYTKLSSEGVTLVDDRVLLPNVGFFIYPPKIAADAGGNFHMVWSESRSGTRQTYYAKFDGNGNRLTPNDIQLTAVTGTNFADDPSLAVDFSQNVHVVWRDSRSGNEEIYYTKLDSNGVTLIDDTRLTVADGPSRSPTIVVDPSGIPQVVWHDFRDGITNGEIYYASLNPDGTVSGTARLTVDQSRSESPSFTVDGAGGKHIVWVDYRDGIPEIYYKGSALPELSCRSSNTDALMVNTGGREFPITTNPSQTDSSDPQLIADQGGDLHLAWVRNDRVYYTRLDRNGNFTGDIRVTNNASEFPDLVYRSATASSSAAVNVVYDRVLGGGESEIFLTRVDPITGSVSGETQITQTPGISTEPALDIDVVGYSELVWVDSQDGPAGNTEIYYRRLDPNGVPVGTPTRLTNDPARSFAPSITSVPNLVLAYAVWQDERLGGSQIFLEAFNPASGVTGVNDLLLSSSISTPSIIISAEEPSVAADSDGNAHVVWVATQGGLVYEVYYAKVSSRGTVLVPATPITAIGARANRPSIAVDRVGRVHVSWADNRTGSNQIYYAILDRNGKRITPDIAATFGAAMVTPEFAMAVDVQLTPHFLWSNSRSGDGRALYSARLTDLTGDPVTHERAVTIGTPFELLMSNPSELPQGRFVLYAWRGEPTAATVRNLPQNLGLICFPTPLQPNDTPQPRAIWNNIGRQRSLGAPTNPSTPAPAVVVSLPQMLNLPGTYTIQGIIDNSLISTPGFTLTNAIILRVR